VAVIIASFTGWHRSALSARSIPVNAPGRFAFLDLPPPGRFRRGHAPKARFKGIAGAAWQPFSLRLLLNFGYLPCKLWPSQAAA
jgi:hypothetical protein